MAWTDLLDRLYPDRGRRPNNLVLRVSGAGPGRLWGRRAEVTSGCDRRTVHLYPTLRHWCLDSRPLDDQGSHRSRIWSLFLDRHWSMGKRFHWKVLLLFLERSSLLFSFLLRPIRSDWISEAALSSLTTWIDPLHLELKVGTNNLALVLVRLGTQRKSREVIEPFTPKILPGSCEK